jgi:hypothetical protein
MGRLEYVQTANRSPRMQEVSRRLFLAAAALTAGAGATALPAAARPSQPGRVDVKTHNASVIDGLFNPRPTLPIKGIVVHHTATKSASLKGISRYHAKRFDDPLGIQYHFLIQNGRRTLPVGSIEVGRWKHQARAIHLFKPQRQPESVAICLVGNFEETRLPGKMLDPLVALCQAFVTHYKIPLSAVTTHTGVDGRLTQCPGKHFPRALFLKRLRPAD